MAKFEVLIKNGTAVTESGAVRCDVGIKDGRIAALGENLSDAAETIDASGLLVLPGGIDSHVHIAQPGAPGIVMADNFESATRSAAFGGNTLVMPFCMQEKGKGLRQALKEYHAKAQGQCYVDTSFHLVISDPSESVLGQELPALVADGYTSFKIFMTYEALKLNDREILEVLSVARETGALVMVHAENDDAIRFLTERLERAGKTKPAAHALSRPIVVEREATHRAISLAELIDVPVMIVHVSNRQSMEEIARAQGRGLKVYGETCPQYLLLTEKDLEGQDMEGAKHVCSPPPRDTREPAGVLGGTGAGHLRRLLLGPLPVPLRGHGRQAASARAAELPLRAERHSRRRDAAADPVFRRRKEGAHLARAFRGAYVHQPRQDLWTLSSQGHDRGRLRRRHCAMGPGAARDDLARGAARRLRLHALRGPRGDRLAGAHHGARQGRGARRQARGREGLRRALWRASARRSPRRSGGWSSREGFEPAGPRPARERPTLL